MDDFEGKPPAKVRRRNWDEQEEQRYFERNEGTRVDQEERDRDAAIANMVEWFFYHFESPEVEHYYDGEKGAYVWPFGGPFDASTQIEDNFGNDYINKEWRDAAVEEITKDGTEQWSPTTEGQFYEHPSPEHPQLGLEVPHISDDTSRDEAVAILLARVQKLEEQIAHVPFIYGHNGPPDEVGLPPYDDADKLTLENVTKVIRTELAKQEPDAVQLEDSAEKVETIGSKILAYSLKSADTVAQEALKFGTKAGMVYLGASLAGIDLSAFGSALTALAVDLVKFVAKFLR